jgi:hypothetical protein
VADSPSSPSLMGPKARELWVTAAISLVVMLPAVLVFYGAGVATGRDTFFTHDIAGSDIWHLNLPIKHFYQRELAEGRLPLWCPDIGTGFPLFAEGQVAALYPINLLLFSTLELILAFNWGILLHAILSGIFAAAFARQLGAGRGASVVAAVVFAFSGFFVTHLKHINMTAVAIWIPLLLLLLERFAARRSAAVLVSVALVVAAMIFAGHPQIAYNNLLVAGVYSIYLMICIGRAAAPRFAAGMLVAVALGLLIGAPQLLPTAELSRLSPRSGGLSIEEATQWRYDWKHLATFVAPRAFGDPGELVEEPLIDLDTGQPLVAPDGRPAVALRGFEVDPREDGSGGTLFWEMTAYVGLLPLLLAGLALGFGHRERNVRVLVGLFVVSILLALGSSGGVFHLLWYALPGFDLFRFHDRFLLYADLALALLAALGVTYAGRRLPEAMRARASWMLVVGVTIVCFVDLKLALGDHNPRIAAERWLAPPASVDAIREAAPGDAPFRIFDYDPARSVFTNAYYRARGWKGDLAPYDVARSPLTSNLNLLYDLNYLNAYFQLYPRWMREASDLIYQAPDPNRGSEGGLNRIADLFNVRFILQPGAPEFDRIPGSDELTPIARALGDNETIATFPGDVVLRAIRTREGRDGFVPGPRYEVRLLENADVLPRAFLVPAGREGNGLLDASFDPKRTLLFTEANKLGGPSTDASDAPIDAEVEILHYGSQRIDLRMNAPRDAWLFISDTWYPGWSAEVNGEPASIERANIVGRAIRVPGGEVDVRLQFAPRSLVIGCWLAAIGFVSILAILVIARRIDGRQIGSP